MSDTAPFDYSVVIPAHNEGAVIDRCLQSMLAGGGNGEIVVVCNGCTDDTAERAKRISDRITVVDLAVGSKPIALNEGDRVATAFPRFYIDADVEVSPGALADVARTMAERRLDAAAPRIRFDVRTSTLPARLYYGIWARSPYFGDGLIGAGFYGLSRGARARFDEWPDIYADDMYILTITRPEERGTATGATFTPLMPRSVRELVKVQKRHYAAKHQFHEYLQNSPRSVVYATPSGDRRWLRRVARDVRSWPGLALFVTVNLYGVAAGKKQTSAGRMTWHQDRSTR
ncbi:MAG: glycosyltransferase family 2 protein [Acidimicrobiia bacterium]